MHKRQVNEACSEEKDRRVQEHQSITVEEIQRRQLIAEKLIAVQKELLANRVPSKVSSAPVTVSLLLCRPLFGFITV